MARLASGLTDFLGSSARIGLRKGFQHTRGAIKDASVLEGAETAAVTRN